MTVEEKFAGYGYTEGHKEGRKEALEEIQKRMRNHYPITDMRTAMDIIDELEPYIDTELKKLEGE